MIIRSEKYEKPENSIACMLRYQPSLIKRMTSIGVYNRWKGWKASEYSVISHESCSDILRIIYNVCALGREKNKNYTKNFGGPGHSILGNSLLFFCPVVAQTQPHFNERWFSCIITWQIDVNLKQSRIVVFQVLLLSVLIFPNFAHPCPLLAFLCFFWVLTRYVLFQLILWPVRQRWNCIKLDVLAL